MKSLEAVGVSEIEDQILHYQSAKVTQWNYQSDRTYPPYIAYADEKSIWFDFSRNLEKTSVISTYPLAGPVPESNFVGSVGQSFMIMNDSSYSEVPKATGSDPYLNPLMVLLDWNQTDDLIRDESRLYREYSRYVLSREVDGQKEYLFIDEKTFFPVKLEYIEPHYLWGQIKVEYLYVTWFNAGQIVFPAASYRLEDGEAIVQRIHGNRNLVSRNEAPEFSLPADYRPLTNSTLFFLRQDRPDTVRVADDIYLLKNRAYTGTIALVGDTVYVFDATQGEQRARYDHEWIQQIFPGNYPFSVVVTDLAWPHIAGVRYWVSQGATVISHKNSLAFLQRIINRKWELSPYELERNRNDTPFHFIPINSRTVIADGNITLAPIDGIGSEGAIMAFINKAGFLWPGDYIQQTNAPTQYAREVWQAVERNGLDPTVFAAQHAVLSSWSLIEDLYRK